MQPHLVFLPGASGQTAFWQPIIDLLGDQYSTQVIAYPGFADHPSDPEVNHFTQLSDYVLAQIPAHSMIIAQSMGGIFAVQAALQQAKKVHKLVLIATSGGIDLSAFDVADWREDYYAQFPHYPQWFGQIQLNYQHHLADIHVPTLLLWGGKDRISPIAVGQYLQQHLPHARLHIVAEGDHHFAAQHAEQVVNYLRPFLQEQEYAD